MKKLISVFLSLVVVGSLMGSAQASPLFLESYGSVVSLSGPAEDDLYTGGGTVNITKPVKGDVIVGGGTVTIDTEVTGDVIVVGGTVNIRGSVGDDVRVAAGQVNIEGTVGDDVIAMAGMVTIMSDSLVKGDVVAMGGEVALVGRINGRVRVNTEELILEGIIDGDAELRYAHEFIPGDKAKIGGKLTYWAPGENPQLVAIASSAVFNKYIPPAGAKGFGITVLIWEYLALLFLGGMLIVFLPKFLPRTVQDIKRDWGKDLWRGFLVLVAMPALALLALITVVGWPIAMLLLLGYMSSLLVSSVVGAMYVGSLVVKFDTASKISIFGSFAVGLAIYVLLDVIPVIGWLLKFIMILLGLGAIWREKLKIIKDYR